MERARVFLKSPRPALASLISKTGTTEAKASMVARAMTFRQASAAPSYVHGLSALLAASPCLQRVQLGHASATKATEDAARDEGRPVLKTFRYDQLDEVSSLLCASR